MVRSRRALLAAALSVFFLTVPRHEAFSLFYGDIKPGLKLVHVNSKTSYFLYVPKGYNQEEKKWPLVVALPEWGTDNKAHAEGWMAEADKRGFIIAVPNWLKTLDATPEAVDRWVFRIVRKVSEKYGVDRSRILLTGYGDGGNYALYLGLRYPKKVSCVAAVTAVLSPNYESLVYYGAIRRNPIPFLIIGDKDDAAGAAASKQTAEKLKANAVDAKYEEVKASKKYDHAAYDSIILNWFESKKKKIDSKKKK